MGMDQFDVTLEDSELLQEVEMTTDLIVAAGRVDRPLTAEEIDAILGVRHADVTTPPPREPEPD